MTHRGDRLLEREFDRRGLRDTLLRGLRERDLEYLRGAGERLRLLDFERLRLLDLEPPRYVETSFILLPNKSVSSNFRMAFCMSLYEANSTTPSPIVSR